MFTFPISFHHQNQNSIIPAETFATTWRTTGANESITLPFPNNGTYIFDVDWGDGNSDTINSPGYSAPTVTHTYATAGDYAVWITGTMTLFQVRYSDATTKLISVENWGTTGLTSCQYMFKDSTGLLEVSATDGAGFANVQSFTEMFYNVLSLTTTVIDVTNWDVSFGQLFNGMFKRCRSVTELTGVGGWDMSNAIAIVQMFESAEKITALDLSAWDVGEVTSMTQFSQYMNLNSTLGDLSAWRPAKLSGTLAMFQAWYAPNTYDLGDLDNWRIPLINSVVFGSYDFTTKITNIGANGMTNWGITTVYFLTYSFRGASFYLGDLSGWDVSAVASMTRCFSEATGSVDGLASWDVSSITLMDNAFYNCTYTDWTFAKFWQPEACTDMSFMFAGTSLDTTEYDQILVNWEAGVHQPNVTAHFGTAKYSAGAPAVARQALVDDGWTITDGGPV